MYRDQYFKGQKVEYHWVGGDKTHSGKIIDVVKVHKEYGGVRITVLWDTGKQREYYGDNSIIILGKIKPLIILGKPKHPHNPNITFMENKEKCTVINTSKAKK